MEFMCTCVCIYIYVYVFFPIALLFSKIPLFSKSRELYNSYGRLFDLVTCVEEKKNGFGIKVFVWRANEKMVFPML